MGGKGDLGDLDAARLLEVGEGRLDELREVVADVAMRHSYDITTLKIKRNKIKGFNK